jgi:hypothetical protein
MENKTKKLEILLVEDNEAHLADALTEIKNRVEAGENINVDVAKDFTEYLGLVAKKSYDGIISDIFFPSDAKSPGDNSASRKVWDIMGKTYCEKHARDYRCGDERKEKMYKLVQDDWMGGKEIPPSGIVVADRAKKAGVPVVLCTDSYHHGIKTQPVFEYALNNQIRMVDAYVEDNNEASASHKNWKGAFDELYELIQDEE